MSNVQQYVDRTPDTSLYVPLYTNPSTGDGIAQANVGAPVALDAFWFKDRAHYLNTADPHSITIKVIGTGTGGIAAGAWINISGLPRFTFIAPPVGSLGQVQAVTAGTVAANIEATAPSSQTPLGWRFRRKRNDNDLAKCNRARDSVSSKISCQ
jgi:hypothetical protein